MVSSIPSNRHRNNRIIKMERANIEGLINNHLCQISFDEELVVEQQVRFETENNTWVIFLNIDIDNPVETSIAKKIKED